MPDCGASSRKRNNGAYRQVEPERIIEKARRDMTMAEQYRIPMSHLWIHIGVAICYPDLV